VKTLPPSPQRRRLMQWSAASLLPLGSFSALAQKAAGQDIVKVVCGFPAGSTSDVTARNLADRLAQDGYAKTGVVENRTGAGAQIAVQYVVGQSANGGTLLQTPMSMLGIYPHTYGKLPYDPVTDLTLVSLACTFDFALAIGPAVPAEVQSLADFLDWTKAHPDQASFGGPAAGAVPHFIGVLLGRANGLELTHVAYRGTQPAIQDVVGGHLPAVIGPVGDIQRFIGHPGYRMLAVTGAERSRFAPDVPTLVEQGQKDFAYSEWYGIYMPPHADADTLKRANAAVVAAFSHPDTIQSLATMGMEAKTSTPQELADLLQSDTERWAPIVREVGFRADS